MNKRVDYIDHIKGLTIWAVVWFHTVHPTWLTATLVNSEFELRKSIEAIDQVIKSLINNK